MSDDVWRRRGHDGDDEFGAPLFDDDAGRSTLSLGVTDAEPLPHWTAPRRKTASRALLPARLGRRTARPRSART